MKKSLLPAIIIYFLFQPPTYAQPLQGQELIDSLLTELSKSKEDTNKVLRLTSLGNEELNISEYEKAIGHCKSALSLSENLNFNKGKSRAYNTLGNIYSEQGNFPEALKNYFSALKIREVMDDKKGVAGVYNNIGLVYREQGNYPEALKMILAALKINESIGNKSWAAHNYNNIGIIYIMQKNYPEALKYLSDANKTYEETGDSASMNHPYNNIASIYYEQGNYPEALKNHTAALRIREKMGDKSLIADSYSNIGLVRFKQGEYAEALKNQFAALKMEEEIGDKIGMASSYQNIGSTKTSMKNFGEARMYLNKGLALNKEIGNIEGIQSGHEDLARLDSVVGNYKGSLENYKMYVMYRDSLFNEDNTKKLVQTQMQYDFDKKEAATKAEQNKKDVLTQAEIKKQRIIRDSVSGGLAIVLLFSWVVYRQRNRISKEKKRSDDLLLNILPEETAEELKATGAAEAKSFDEVTVMFTDFKNFTQASEQMNAKELVSEINYIFSEFDKIISKHNIEKIKTIGDSYMCAGGLPVANKTNAIDVVQAAIEIQGFIIQLKQEREKENKYSFEIRIGIHTGPVVAGIVGIKKFAYDIWGDTVNIASRMESSGEAGKVNISGATYEIAESKFTCTYRGKIQAKNKGEIDMYFVNNSISEG